MGWCTRELHRRDEGRGGRENDKAASQREAGVWSQMYAPQRQAPMPHPRCTLCPVLLCHWRLPGSTYKWGAAFSFFCFLFNEVKAAGSTQPKSEGQTPYDCALLGSMETGKRDKLDQCEFITIWGEMQVPVFFSVLSSPDATYSSFTLKLDGWICCDFPLFLLFEDYLHLCHGGEHDGGYRNRMD